MILFRVILPVTDIEKAAHFYGLVLEESGERVSPGRHYFRCGSTILACYDPVADGDTADPASKMHENQYLYFSSPDLARVADRIARSGGEVVSEIEVMPWGEESVYARDPFGNPICFVEAGTEFLGGVA